jgi:hypothetical protein
MVGGRSAAQELLGQFARQNSAYIAQTLEVRSLTSQFLASITYEVLQGNRKFGGFVIPVAKERDAPWRICDGGQNSWTIGAAGRLCFSPIVS